MRKNVLTFLVCAIIMFAISAKSNAQSVLIYYWSFNGGDSSVHTPDITAAGAGSATYWYWCLYTDYTTGSSVNLQSGYTSGNCIRFRQPSDSVTFSMPTTGYEHIRFSYAEQRTNSGALTNSVLYSTDGINFVSTSMVDAADSSTYTIDSTDASSGSTTEWEYHTFNIADGHANDNANFAITIVFNGGPDSTSGNDRFDNVTLQGDPFVPEGVTTVNLNDKPVYNLFPNPVAGNLLINASMEGDKSISIYNEIGQMVYEGTADSKNFSVNTSNLEAGVYIISILEKTTGSLSTLKFAKQ